MSPAMCCVDDACTGMGEGDTNADATRCGTCDNKCSSGKACRCGTCESITQLATKLDEPWNIAVDRENGIVYWTNGETVGRNSGALMSVRADGCGGAPTQQE